MVFPGCTDAALVMLVKYFNPKTDGRARSVAFCVCGWEFEGSTVPRRDSIEVRALVFHLDDVE